MSIAGVKEVFRPATLDEALRYMADCPGARPIAGGTDLLVALRARAGAGAGAGAGGGATQLVDVGHRGAARSGWATSW